jgi:hypothetical protein
MNCGEECEEPASGLGYCECPFGGCSPCLLRSGLSVGETRVAGAPAWLWSRLPSFELGSAGNRLTAISGLYDSTSHAITQLEILGRADLRFGADR